MKKISLILALISAINANAQDYFLSFAGKGESSTVSSVVVENLATGTSLTLSGTDILHLKGLITSADLPGEANSGAIKISPNPMKGSSVMAILPPAAGEAVISIYDMSGRLIARNQEYLEREWQELTITGPGDGIFLVNVTGKNYKLTEKLVCNGSYSGSPAISKSAGLNRLQLKASDPGSKGSMATVEMKYSEGDRLKLTGISGIYTTIIVDIPVSSKLVTFTFIACTDGEGNNYPVIQIGTGKSVPQIWMAVNLKSTKYNDGTPIQLVTDNTAWASLNSGAYCWYNNNSDSYKAVYGALYNWHAVNSTKLCPTGWHVPSFDEWSCLNNTLGGQKVAGGKLKETGTLHWQYPNKGATNETGFTALPGGYRNSEGTFGMIGNFCKLWLSIQSGSSNAYCEFLYYSSTNVDLGILSKKSGLTVRCIKNQ